jgi:hypothetical protein
MVAFVIENEMAAEVTAREMGWVPLESEDGATVWVCSKDISVDDVAYSDTALEVVRTFTH